MINVSIPKTLVALAAGVSFLACDPHPTRTPNSDPCHPKPPGRCETDVECTPFLCKSGLCATACKTNATCAQGYICSQSVCIKAGTCGTCSGNYDCPATKQCDLLTASCVNH